ncbi:MAG: tRNA 2-thiouridine(34) synthase MnmA [Bacteroidales bacterium]|nr:tRNA 2-thiouridine(34) synthase MnmA [Bacteroidales bacterium]
MKKKVVIGLSGGVDSSVAAWVLKEQGYEVSGLFMKNWHDNTGVLEGDCSAEDDLMFAEMVARKLDIPFYKVDLSEPYRKRVLDYMFSEYKAGRTPNPDILCNREIKFDSFVREAVRLGADLVATGHYCRKETISPGRMEIHRLLSGTDRNKDQSYFLCQITQDQLAGAYFPIGNMTKPEVRKLASDLQLPTADRKDSQGICFIGKVDLPSFLQQQLKPRTGRTVLIPADTDFPVYRKGLPGDDTPDEKLLEISSPYLYNPSAGPTIGKHKGAHFFTVGQRKGINIGGYKEPLFILATDCNKNIIYAGEGQDHPGLYRKGLMINDKDIHWIRPDLVMKEGETREYDVRIRYRQPLERAKLFRRSSGMFIIFDSLQRGIAPGQFAAWYTGDELLGSGVINS